MKTPDELWLEFKMKEKFFEPLGMVEYPLGYDWNGKKYLFVIKDGPPQDNGKWHYYLSSETATDYFICELGKFKEDDPQLAFIIEHSHTIKNRISRRNPKRVFYDLYDKDGVYLSISNGYKVNYFLRRLLWRIKSIVR